MMKTQIERITPAIAKLWLTRNTANRPMRPTHAETLRQAFARGRVAPRGWLDCGGAEDMSDEMLLGVLRMPLDTSDPLMVAQFVGRARQAADRIEADAARIAALQAERDRAGEQLLESAATVLRLVAERDALLDALRRISLCSQNSMSSKEECGRIARAAIDAARGAP